MTPTEPNENDERIVREDDDTGEDTGEHEAVREDDAPAPEPTAEPGHDHTQDE